MTLPKDYREFIVLLNGRSVRYVLEEFGFPVGAFSANVFEQDVIQVGFAPVRIDLLTSLSGVTFEEVAASAAHDVIDGVKLSIISKDVLIKNRKATGRPRDIADIEALERVQPRR
jgi:hypothetical protein